VIDGQQLAVRAAMAFLPAALASGPWTMLA
jgi:hypothetical protein